jgi:DNA-binding CsgD family transcriptional regulator
MSLLANPAKNKKSRIFRLFNNSEIPAKKPILSIGNTSSFSSLLDSIFLESEFQVKKADSVNSGIDMLKISNSYSVVLFRDRDLPNTSEKRFLDQLQELAPLTSRVMVSNSLSNTELKSKVAAGKIHSYYRDVSPPNTGTVKMAVTIGHKFHCNNLLRCFLNSVDLDSISRKGNIQKYRNIIDWLKLQKGFEDDSFDFVGRQLELTLLAKDTKSIHESIPNFQNQIVQIEETLKKDKNRKNLEEVEQFIKQNQYEIGLLGEKIIANNKHLEESICRARNRADAIGLQEKEIRRLKDEINFKERVVPLSREHLDELSELGKSLLIGTGFNRMMENAATNLARVLGMKFISILEYLPESNSYILQAGIGWKESRVDNARVEDGLKSQADYTLLSNHPVILKNPETETRFSAPPLFLEQEIASGISISIPGDNHPYGVILAHCTCPPTLSYEEIKVLEFIANILALGINAKTIQQSAHKITECDADNTKNTKRINNYETIVSRLVNQCYLGKQNVTDAVETNLHISIFPMLSRISFDCEKCKPSADILDNCLHGITEKSSSTLIEKYAFTAKEAEISGMIKNDLRTKEIASLLKVSERTVENHRNQIRKKLGLSGKVSDLRSFLMRLE